MSTTIAGDLSHLSDGVPEGVGILAVMDSTGDTKLQWSKDNEDEIDNARETFSRLTKKGHQAYKVDRKGNKGERITTFDPNAEMIILAPALVGG